MGNVHPVDASYRRSSFYGVDAVYGLKRLMKIAVCNSVARLVGGAEIYLARLIPTLADAGHEVALLFDTDTPADRAPITRAGAKTWIISELKAQT